MESESGKNELIQYMSHVEMVPFKQDRELALQTSEKTPIGRLAALGTGLEPLVSAFQNVTSGGEAKSGLYRVTIDPGTRLAKFKDGSGYIGNAYDAKNKLDNRARLNPLACDPTMLFVAATLANIDKKLDDIKETQLDMLDFLQQKEKSELRGNLNFLMDLYNNYKYNWNSEKYKTANHIKALDIRQNAGQMIDFYRERIKKHVSKKAFLHRDQDVKKQLETVKDEFKEYQLALYLFGFSSFIEVLLQENFDQAYLNAITDKLQKLSLEYRELFTGAYAQIESKSKSSLESKLVGGLSVVNKLAGETVAKIPGVKKTQFDRTLLSASEKLDSFKDKRVEMTMSQLIARQSSSVRPFIDNIKLINELYNEPVTLLFDKDYLYLNASVSA